MFLGRTYSKSGSVTARPWLVWESEITVALPTVAFGVIFWPAAGGIFGGFGGVFKWKTHHRIHSGTAFLRKNISHVPKNFRLRRARTSWNLWMLQCGHPKYVFQVCDTIPLEIYSNEITLQFRHSGSYFYRTKSNIHRWDNSPNYHFSAPPRPPLTDIVWDAPNYYQVQL